MPCTSTGDYLEDLYRYRTGLSTYNPMVKRIRTYSRPYSAGAYAGGRQRGTGRRSVSEQAYQKAYAGRSSSMPLYRRMPAARAVAYAGEVKGVDTPLSLSPVIDTVNTNASSFVLNLVQAGTGSWNRVGRKISMRSVRISGSVLYTFIERATTGQILSNQLRMVVVWDKQPSGGAVPTFDNIFGVTEQNGTESSHFLDPLRFDGMDRFQILRDKRIVFNPSLFNAAGGTTDGTEIREPIDEFIPLGGRQTNFSGQSTPMTITDINSGALYVFFRSDGGLAEQVLNIQPETHARLRYVD